METLVKGWNAQRVNRLSDAELSKHVLKEWIVDVGFDAVQTRNARLEMVGQLTQDNGFAVVFRFCGQIVRASALDGIETRADETPPISEVFRKDPKVK